MKKKKDLVLRAAIENGVIKYKDADFKDKIEKFKSVNEFQDIEITFANASSVEFFQHKYYRGYLLPDAAHFYGEKDTEYVHIFVLKKDFLMERIDDNDVKSIPARFRKRCILLSEKRIKVDELGEVQVDENGNEIEHDVIWAYIPSTADLTYQEMKIFIDKVEHRLFADLNGRLGETGDPEEANAIREKSKTQDLINTFDGKEVK